MPIAFTATGQQYRQITASIYPGGEIMEGSELSDEIDRLIHAGWMSFSRFRQELYDRPTASVELVVRMVKSEVVDVNSFKRRLPENLYRTSQNAVSNPRSLV